MNQPDSRLLELYQRYMEQTSTEEERRELMNLIKQDEMAPAFHQLIDNSYDNNLVDEEMAAARAEEIFRAIVGEEAPQRTIAPIHRVHFIRRWWWGAAAVLFLLLAGGYLYISSQKKEDGIVKEQPVKIQDLQPGKDGAVLTLADGSQVVLDSLGNGIVTTQNGANVVLQNGRLAYEQNNKVNNTIAYNTISTPKGRQFQLLLPDGTKVYLNAASTLTYPTAFVGNERSVQVTGEAYFEVAHDATKPFRVQLPNDGGQIEVLGTHFNVNAYQNEAAIRTTLIEGRVKVEKSAIPDKSGQAGNRQSAILKPGEQASLSHSSQTSNRIPVQTVDLDKVTAWRKGIFDFNDVGLREMMRQIERWYDLEVAYEGNVPEVKFFGKVSRSSSLSTVLEALDGFGLHYRVEGRKLIIYP